MIYTGYSIRYSIGYPRWYSMRYIYIYMGYIGGALYSGRFSIEYYIGYSFFNMHNN